MLDDLDRQYRELAATLPAGNGGAPHPEAVARLKAFDDQAMRRLEEGALRERSRRIAPVRSRPPCSLQAAHRRPRAARSSARRPRGSSAAGRTSTSATGPPSVVETPRQPDITAAVAALGDREAEKALVASVLDDFPLDPRCVEAAIAAGLRSEDFSDVRLAEVFAVAVEVFPKTRPGDLFRGVVDELDRRGRLDLIGGRNFLARLRRWDFASAAGSLWSPGGPDTVRWITPHIRALSARRRGLAAAYRLVEAFRTGDREMAAAFHREAGEALAAWPIEGAA